MTTPTQPAFVPPIVLAEGLDVSVYVSEEAVARHIEEWFPADAEYRAYDSEGRELELTVELAVIPRRWFKDRTYERVGVRAIESEPGHAAELAELLAEWLRETGAPEPSADATLNELLSQAVERGDLMT